MGCIEAHKQKIKATVCKKLKSNTVCFFFFLSKELKMENKVQPFIWYKCGRCVTLKEIHN